MSTQLKLTNQEKNILNYLQTRNGKEVNWEELAQFAKDPANVKLKTIQKAVSDLKRKFVVNSLPIPFDVSFTLAAKPTNKESKPQVLIQVKRTPDGNITTNISKHPAQIDFILDPLGFKRVRTKYGNHQLNDSEWEMFKYFYHNPGKLIPLSELRDKVVFQHYGSKLPARWFDSIMRVINNLRRQVVGLDKRLLTVKGSETSYLFQ